MLHQVLYLPMLDASQHIILLGIYERPFHNHKKIQKNGGKTLNNKRESLKSVSAEKNIYPRLRSLLCSAFTITLNNSTSVLLRKIN
jgi:hypothetical protein